MRSWSSTQARRRGARTLLAALAIGALVAGCSSDDDSGRPTRGQLADPRTPVDYEYVIPAGTGDRIQAGEDLEIIPAELTVKVGETMRIVNYDTRSHIVGPFFVAKGETVTQRFSTAGEIIAECSIHPSERIVINVVE